METSRKIFKKFKNKFEKNCAKFGNNAGIFGNQWKLQGKFSRNLKINLKKTVQNLETMQEILDEFYT